MSVSGGSSMGSGGSDNMSTVDPISSRQPGGEDDMGLDEGQAFKQGIFGVLYTVSKEKSYGWRWAGFKLGVDFLQIWLILVNPTYGYTGWITQENKLWQVVALINLSQFLQARGYTFFLGAMYVMAVGLVIAIGLCAWVGYSFQNNRFDHVWPIVVLRSYSVVFFQILDVASFTLFLETLDCQLWFTEHPSRGVHALYPDVHCWAMPHMIHVATGMISLVLFTIMAGAFTMAEMHDLNPLSSNPLAMAHSKVEVTAFAIKFIMTAASTLVMNLKWLSSIQAACCLLLVWLYFKWVPHMNTLTNNIRIGLYSSIFYCSLMLLLLGFLPAVDYNDMNAVREFQQNITYVMWAGIIPAFGLGWLAGDLRQKQYSEKIMDTLREAFLDSKSQITYRFIDGREVEILCRCCRTMSANGEPDPGEVALAEYIIKMGCTQLPNNAFMILLYSSFLIDVQTSYQSGYSILQTAKKADPSFLERFAIFSREQQHAQKSSATQPGQGSDLVSYVEFQRNYRLVLKVHREALMAVKTFWMCLLQRNVKFDSMSSHIDQIEHAVKQADRIYRNVLQRHASSVKVVRLYAKFLEHVKHDPWAAAKWTAESEKLELLEEESKANNVFDDLETLDPSLKHNLEAMGPLNDVRAIIIINAQCIVQAANQASCDMFGFSRAELVGRDVNCIIPPPFSDHHTNYVQSYITTGKSVLVGRTNEFVAIHKEKHVVPIRLHVSKVSGIGQDTMFLGVLEAMPPPADTAEMWVLFNGQLVCVDPTFTDWFAYKNEEVIGSALSNYVVDYKKLEQPLREARGLHSREQAQVRSRASSVHSSFMAPGRHVQEEWLVPGLTVAHKYADPVSVDAVITITGVGNHFFTKLAFKRIIKSSGPREMLVSDKKGRIMHMTSGLASALGSTPKTLMAQDSRDALQSLMVQPYAQLHKTLGMHVPPHAPPAYSCRAGLSMLMSSVGPQGPDAAPFRMHVRRKLQGGESNVWHVAILEKRTLKQAVQERCMMLVLDAQGYVIDLPNEAGVTPFGMRSNSLMGLHISSFVDILSVPGATPGQSTGPSLSVGELDMTGAVAGKGRKSPGQDGVAAGLGYATPEAEKSASSVLMELATKSLESPGVSWRCNVTRPDTHEALARHKHLPAAAILGRARVKPGMMSVSLLIDEACSSHSSSPRVTMVGAADDIRQSNPGYQGALSQPGGALKKAGSVDLGGQRRSSMLSAMGEIDEIRFQVKLWRAKVCSSIIEVDGAGRVVGSSPGDKLQMLYPAGLVLGAPDDELYGQHLSELLPLGSKGVRALFDVLPIEGGAAKPKSLLKRAPVVNDKTPGPVQIMTTKHLGDFRDIKITVQAIPKLGRTNNMYLLIHPHEPQGGRPNFAAWVLGGGLTPVEKAQEVDKHLQKQLHKALSRRQSFSNALALMAAPALAPAAPPGPFLARQAGEPSGFKNNGDGLLDLDKVEEQLQAIKAAPRQDVAAEEEEERGSEGDHLAVAAAAKNPRIVKWIMSEMGDAPPNPAMLQPLDDDDDEVEDEDEDEESDDKSDDKQESDNAEDVDAAAAQVGSEGTDYRRGRRYKKLLRVLSSAVMQRDVIRFKRHTYGVVAALLVAHVAVFAIMYLLLSKQKDGVQDLNRCGLALGYAGEIGMMSRQLELLIDPFEGAVVVLEGLAGPDDIPPLREEYERHVNLFKEMHSAFYLGADGSGRVLPDINGLREIWETPQLEQVVFMGIPINETIDFNHTVVEHIQYASLWDIGNNIVTAAFQILVNGFTYEKEYGHMHMFPYFQYIMRNMPAVFAEHYYETMDTMVQWVIQGAMNVNQVQQILLVIEGAVLCSIACFYLWHLALLVAGQRFTVFQVFLAIPLGLARGLATKKLDLGDDDEEDDDADAPPAGATTGGTGDTGHDKPSIAEAQRSPGAISVFLRQTEPGPEAAVPLSFWQKLLGALMFWKQQDTQNQALNSKRKLMQSYKQPLLLIWPFVVWGACIIATYAIGVTKLASISGPIATYNMVNSVKSRAHIFYHALQELAIEEDQPHMDEIRADLMIKEELLAKDYRAMMYGGQALPNETSKHFTLATLGLTYSGGRAADILFYTTSCLCEDPKDCKDDPTNIYYEDTHNGLARLMNQFLKNSEAVGQMHGLDPWLFGPEFAWFWYVKEDILGGLALLNQYYHSYVMQVYGSVLQIHIAALILTCIIMLGFVMLVLRPFIRKSEYETKRIAELLSQLPPDLDVESLVLRAMPKNPAAIVPETSVAQPTSAVPTGKGRGSTDFPRSGTANKNAA